MQNLKEFFIYTKKSIGRRDSYAILMNAEALGMEEKMLVEDAASEIAAHIERSHKEQKFLFVCGTGGKGAVGMALARHVMGFADVKVALVGDPSAMHNATTKLNYRLLSTISEVEAIGDGDGDRLKAMAKEADNVVDGLFGVGLRGSIRGIAYDAIKAINDSGRNVISIDMPTGFDADTGTSNVIHVKANEVFTLHKLKNGMLRNRSVSGVVLLDIGVPESAELLTGPGDVMMATEPRAMQSNKYSSGSVLVIGGSEDYHGAPALASFSANAAFSALRLGAGYVTILVPKAVEGVVKRISPSLIVRSFNDNAGTAELLGLIKEIKHKSVVIGPGLKEDGAAAKALSEIIKYESKAGNCVVVDGGAIKALGRHKTALGKNTVITPHEGEFKAIYGADISGKGFNWRVKASIEFAKRHGCVLVLKGHDTIITDGDLLKINRASTPALATMGTGDVLAGIIAAYMSTHRDAFESAVAGVYVHSALGDRLSGSKGNHIIAQDLIDGMPEFLKGYDRIA